MQNDIQQSESKRHIFTKIMESSAKSIKLFRHIVCCAAILANWLTVLQANCINNTNAYVNTKKESKYYLLNGYIRDTDIISAFDDSVLMVAFEEIDKETLKRYKITSYDTFRRVMTRYNKSAIACDREAFIHFIASYMQKFFTLEEAQELYDFTHSKLGEKDSAIDKEINLKFIELSMLAASLKHKKDFEIRKSQSSELSSNGSNKLNKKKSILELIDAKKENQLVQLALLSMETYLHNFDFLSPKDIRNILDSIKTATIEYSMRIKSNSYSQEELDSLISFYKTKAGQNITLAWLNTYGSELFDTYTERYYDHIFESVTNYFDLKDGLSY